MKMIPLKEWAAEYFTRPPTQETLQQWARDGSIPAKKVGGRYWYVDGDAGEVQVRGGAAQRVREHYGGR